MPTERQIAASRANGAKSRGPVTPAGQRNSAGNNVRHGLLARTIVLDCESAERFDALHASLTAELQPASGIERALVENMALSRWRIMRLWIIEKSLMDHEIRKQNAAAESGTGPDAESQVDIPTRASLAFRALCDQSHALQLINRYEARLDRQYAYAIQQFFETRQRRTGSLNKLDFAA